MTNTNLTVAQAELQLKAAERELQAARDRQAIIDSYPEVGQLFAVMAVEPDFQQFVSYSEEGVLVAIFDHEERAQSFAEATPNPPGKELVVRTVRLRK